MGPDKIDDADTAAAISLSYQLVDANMTCNKFSDRNAAARVALAQRIGECIHLAKHILAVNGSKSAVNEGENENKTNTILDFQTLRARLSKM
jgi:hypothetical protein